MAPVMIIPMNPTMVFSFVKVR
jgi:hypothetical protein